MFVFQLVLLHWLRRGRDFIFMCMYGYDVPLHVLVLYVVVCYPRIKGSMGIWEDADSREM
jgi:hypothetical protein